jgi:hypothetical protein
LQTNVNIHLNYRIGPPVLERHFLSPPFADKIQILSSQSTVCCSRFHFFSLSRILLRVRHWSTGITGACFSVPFPSGDRYYLNSAI